MHRLSLVPLLLLLLSLQLHAGSGELRFANQQQRDKFADNLLASIRQQMLSKGMDPLRLPDAKDSFRERIWLLFTHYDVTGRAELTDMQVSGISNIRRVGRIHVGRDDSTVWLSGSVRIRNIQIRGHALASLLKLRVSNYFRVAVWQITMHLRVKLRIANGVVRPELRGFSISSMSHPRISALGSSAMDRLLSQYLSLLDTSFWPAIFCPAVEDMLRHLLPKLALPLPSV